MPASTFDADDAAQRPFSDLTPDLILAAVDGLGLTTDGRLLALNSYENRVVQVGLEDQPPVVVKFYRPGRWSDEAILEEHAFSQELADAELSVVAPLAIAGDTLHHHAGHRLAVFPRRGGHAPELGDRSVLSHIGGVLGRWHQIGAARPFVHRRNVDGAEDTRQHLDWLLAEGWIAGHLEAAFESLGGDLIEHIDAAWARAGAVRAIRLHGDCHPGNILWRDDQAHFVDLDDCRMGPAIQDLWMLWSGDRHEREQQLGWLMEGYGNFCHFDERELHLIEALRTQRMIAYQAWLAQRWHDPAFPQAFPWFDQPRHWETLILQLREQLDALQEPALVRQH